MEPSTHSGSRSSTKVWISLRVVATLQLENDGSLKTRNMGGSGVSSSVIRIGSFPLLAFA
jgi:hypothetical protein